MPMELVLKEKVENSIPAIIAWNNEDLMVQAKSYLAQYEGIVYDETAIGIAKTDRATLNKVSDALNNERLRIKSIYEAPYLKFKAEVDEVISIINTVASTIGSQITAFETKRQEEKQAEIKQYFNVSVGVLAEFIKYEQIHNPKWLNASVSLKAVKTEIDSIFKRIDNELGTINMLKAERENELKAYYFRYLDLSAALAENERLKAESQRIQEAKAKLEAQAELQAEIDTQVNIEQPPMPTPTQSVTLEPQVEKKFTLKFEVTATKAQLEALKECLVKNNISYKAVKEN